MLDDLVLVLGEDTCEAIHIKNRLVECLVLAARLRAILEHARGVLVVAKPETASGLLRNRQPVASDYLDFHTKPERIIDCLLRVLTWRIEDRKEADELKAVALTLVVIMVEFLVCDCDCLQPVLDILGLVARSELDDDAGHALSHMLQLDRRLLTVRDLRALVDGVERLEVEELDAGARACRVVERTDNAGVDSVLVLRAGSICGEQDDVVGWEVAVGLDDGLVDRKLVRRERADLVRVQDVTPASSSIVMLRVTIALCLASCCAPTARAMRKGMVSRFRNPESLSPTLDHVKV